MPGAPFPCGSASPPRFSVAHPPEEPCPGEGGRSDDGARGRSPENRSPAVGTDPGEPPAKAAIDDACSICLSPPPGHVAAVLGPGACSLALRSLAAPLLSGTPVTAVDGGNRFDPYAVARAAAALGGSPALALSRLRLSRAFTCHQLEALLSSRL